MASFRSFDGTDIEYTVRGEGHPFILVNGLACVESYWKYTIRHFTPQMQVITYDLRGHGKSGPPAEEGNVHIADHARDLEELVKHLEVESPVVAGFSLGVQIMFESYRQFGDKLGALVAVTGPYQNPLGTFYGLPIPDKAIDGVFAVAEKIERQIEFLWRKAFASPFIYPISRAIGACKCAKEDIQGFYDHAKEMDVGLFFKFAQAAAKHSAADVLPEIEIPTLIIGAEKDTFTPPSLSEHMAKSIPQSDYLHLDGGTHTAIVEQPHVINPRIESFLREKLPHALGLAPR